MGVDSDGFELGVYDPDGRPLGVADFLAARERGEIDWLPSHDDSVLMLTSGGRDWLGERWNFGDLALVVEQLDDVARRLRLGELAILRSAVIDQPAAPYLVFEPGADGVTRISEVFIPDPAHSLTFPVAYWPDRNADDLFAYVREHRDELVAADPHGEAGFAPSEVPLATPALIDALERAAQLGRSVRALLTVP